MGVGRGHERMGAWPAVGDSEYVAAVGNAVLAQAQEEGMMPAGTRQADKRPEGRTMEDKKWEGTFTSNTVSILRCAKRQEHRRDARK